MLVNGTLAEFFNSSCSLRQGDLLSPFFFIFFMEAFGRMVEVATGGGFLFEFLVGNGIIGSIIISHLLFANDTLLFCKANRGQIQALRALLML